MGDLMDDNDPFEEDIHFDQAGLLGGKSLRSKHYHNATGFLPTFMLFSRTVFLCIAFTGLGMCSSITHNPVIKIQQWLGVPEWEALHTFTAHSFGALLGGLLGAKLFDVYNRQFLVFLALVWVSVSVAVLPFTLPISLWWMRATLVAVSSGIAFLFTGGNVLCLDIWGRQGGGGALQALHFSFALGAFIAPVIIHPFFNGPQTEAVSPTTTALPTTVLQEMLEPLSTDLGDGNLIRLPRFAFTTPRYNNMMALSEQDLLTLTKSHTNNVTFQTNSLTPTSVLQENAMKPLLSNQTFNNYTSTLHSIIPDDSPLNRTSIFEDSTYNNTDVSGQSNETAASNVKEQLHSSNSSTAAPDKVDIIPNNPKPARPKPSFTGATVKEKESPWKKLSSKKVAAAAKEHVIESPPPPAAGREGESTASAAGSPALELPVISEKANASSETAKQLKNDTLIQAQGSSNSSSESPAMNNEADAPDSNSNAVPNTTELNSDDDPNHLVSKLSTAAPNVYSTIESTSYSSVSVNTSLTIPSELPTLNLPTTFPILSSVLNDGDIPIKSASSSIMAEGDHSMTERNQLTSLLPKSSMNNLSTDVISKDVSPISKVGSVVKPSISNVEPVSPIIPQPTMLRTDDNDETHHKGGIPYRTGLQRTLPSNTSNTLLTVSEPEVQDLKEPQIKKPSVVTPISETNEKTVISETNEKTVNSTNKIADASANIFHSIVGLLKKPGTFSNMTDNHNKFIENIAKKFQGYGVTKIHLAFICISIFLMLNSMVFVVILCHNPREPRSKQEKGFLDQTPHSRFNFFIVFFSLFMFTSEALQGAIHHLLASNSETNGLSILEKGIDGPALFWGLVCLIRFLCIMLSGCIHLKPGKILGVSTFFTAIGTVFLCIGSFDKDDFMWSGIILASIGLAPILPTSLLWMSQHMIVSHKMCAVMIILTSFGNSLTHGGLAYVASKSHFYTYILVGLSLSSLLLLVLSWCIIYTSVKGASNHLSGSVANELTTSEGYRLARQHEDDDSDGMEMQGQLPRPRHETDQHRQLLHDHHHHTSQADQRMFLYQDEGALLID